jgi:hypothetical protein
MSARNDWIKSLDDGIRSGAEIAALVGCQTRDVYQARHRLRHGRKPRRVAGEAPRAREALARVQAAMAAGQTRTEAVKETARAMGVIPGTVRAFLHMLGAASYVAHRMPENRGPRVPCPGCGLTLFDAEELAQGHCHECLPPAWTLATARADGGPCIESHPHGGHGS